MGMETTLYDSYKWAGFCLFGIRLFLEHLPYSIGINYLKIIGLVDAFSVRYNPLI